MLSPKMSCFENYTTAEALLLAGHIVLNIVVAVLIAPIETILLFHVFPHGDEAKTKGFAGGREQPEVKWCYPE